MRNQNKMLAKAISIAAGAHVDDLDKGGKAYILHCIRVMQRLRTDDAELMQIAILHDTVEDHGDLFNLEWLRTQGFSERVLEALKALTHKGGVAYDDYIINLSYNEDAVKVKLEDLRDNSDITRLKGIGEKDLKRMEKYHKAYLFLNNEGD